MQHKHFLQISTNLSGTGVSIIMIYGENSCCSMALKITLPPHQSHVILTPPHVLNLHSAKENAYWDMTVCSCGLKCRIFVAKCMHFLLFTSNYSNLTMIVCRKYILSTYFGFPRNILFFSVNILVNSLHMGE